MTREEQFYQALSNIFIGAKIEGKSGYINLMAAKAAYFKRVFLPALSKEIDQSVSAFPEFKEELFQKLYTFFSPYFSESGSIYFRHTPVHKNLYEKVYQADQDVTLFWKTHMLYYVKTDVLFKNIELEIDGTKFKFDTRHLIHKKANEKKELVFELNGTPEKGLLEFRVAYSERGKKTSAEKISRQLKKEGIIVASETLERAFAIFKRQGEVDFFINKNAGAFLKHQFNLWFYQYVFSGQSDWDARRLKQLQVLKHISFKIIDFISRFEDELVKIWNKPKFALNAHYVITLDRIAERDLHRTVLRQIVEHPNFVKQISEWRELGLVDEGFSKKHLFTDDRPLKLNKKFKHLPVDTRFFKDLEVKILSLFDSLDRHLDGWLIKSDSYQALNTILPKFKERVQTIYIDPPFNLGAKADFFYNVNYKDATWLTLLENRLQLARELLSESGAIFVRCDYNGNMYVKLLMNQIFGSENYKNEILINRKRESIGTPNKFEVENEFLYFYGKSEKVYRKDLYKSRSVVDFKWTGFLKQEERRPPERVFFGKTLYPPPGQHFSLVQNKVDKLLCEHYLRLKCKHCGALYYWDEAESKENFLSSIYKKRKERFKYFDLKPQQNVYGVTRLKRCLNCNEDEWKVEYLTSSQTKITDNWKDIPSYEDTVGFRTQNSEILLKRVIESTSEPGDLVLDFFLGSGTTIAVAHKLKRKWLGIELGQHFYDVVLPRMKKVMFYDRSGISREKDVKSVYNEHQAGGFFKYYELEQYEDTLSKVRYQKETGDTKILDYLFLNDLKLLHALKMDAETSRVQLKLERIYENIDLAETLSNLTGQWITKIDETSVELEDGQKLLFSNLPIHLIKPLIWWR